MSAKGGDRMSAGNPSDFTEELERLARLKASGALSDDEFQKLKEKLLAARLDSVVPAAQSLSPPRMAADEEGAASRYKGYFSLLFVVFLFLGPFIYPLVMEGTGNECSALERGALRVVDANKPDASNGFASIFVNALQHMSNGAFAQALATKKYPNMPPVLACTAAYYEMRFNGDIPNQPDTSDSSSTNNAPTDTTELPRPAQSNPDVSPDTAPSAPQEPSVEPLAAPASNDAVLNSKGTDIAPMTATPAPMQNVAPLANAPPSQPAEASTPTGHWYYCDPAKAYFPYVQRCPVPWRAVAPNSAAAQNSTGAPEADRPPTSLTGAPQ